MVRRAAELSIAFFSGCAVAIGAATWWQASQSSLPPLAPATQSMPASSSSVPPPPPAPRHLYEVAQGVSYGYTAELTPDQRQTGQVAPSVVMVNFAGEREGRYQVHTRRGKVFVAFECSAPCALIKVMSVMDIDGLRSNVTTEHIRAAPNVIATMALQDAINGQMTEYAQEYEGRPYELWVDEVKGLTRRLAKR